jgi:hypothetical protein
MDDLLIGVLGLGAVLALGAVVACLIVVSRKRRRRVWALEEQRRQSRRRRLLSSLESLDLAMTRLSTAALRGSDQFAQERAVGMAQVVDAANRSGDDELRRLSEVVVARCDALSAVGREGGDGDRLVRQLGEAQREVYRRMEMLLDQTLD